MKGTFKEGLKPLKTGFFGAGIYLTNSYNIASYYVECRGQDNSKIKKLTYLFVNQVKRIKPPSSPRKFAGKEVFREYLEKHPVLQTFDVSLQKTVDISDDVHDTYDSKGRKNIQGTSKNVDEKNSFGSSLPSRTRFLNNN